MEEKLITFIHDRTAHYKTNYAKNEIATKVAETRKVIFRS